MITIELKKFEALTLLEFYEIMALRQEVFIVEQNCPYLDADGKDPKSWHLMLRNEAGSLVSYARLLPKGVSYSEYCSIGRVVSSPSVRGQGAGVKLMNAAVENTVKLFNNDPIKIGAQSYLIRFYEGFGFVDTGENYLEDGIPHTIMIRDSE